MTHNAPHRIIVLGNLQLASPIASYLRELNLAIDAVPDCADALELWRSGDYALVLCLCPDTAAAALRLASTIREEEALHAHIPIIAVLGSGLHREVAGCWHAGIDDTLTMPVDGPSLCAMVRQWLDGEPAGDDVVWDAGALTRLIGPSPSTHARLIARFMQSASEQLDSLNELSASGDEAGIRDVLHKLKSAARTVGACQLAAQCQEFEYLPHLSQSEVAGKAVSQLHGAWARVLPFLTIPEQPK